MREAVHNTKINSGKKTESHLTRNQCGSEEHRLTAVQDDLNMN